MPLATTKDEILPGLSRNVSPHGRVMAVSMMKDEGPYVIEWIAHHLAVGFTDFVIYTNDCTDGTDKMLIRMQELGLVQHRDNKIAKGMKPQPSALKYAQAEPEVAKSDWVIVFDADEFLSIRHADGRLDTMISDIKAAGANGMVITWRIFGSGGVQDWSRAPVTEQYLMAAPPMWNKGWGVKTLFQFDPDKWKLGIHRPKFKNKMLDTDFPNTIKWLNGSGREMEEYFKFRGWRSIVRTVGYDWAQMNHYAIKSIDAYAIRRLRGNVNNKADKYNADYWALQDRNEVRDDTMLRYKPERDRIIAALLSDPVLGKLHHAAVEGVETKLAELRKTDPYRELVESLKVAGAVPITQVSAAPPQPRDKEKIAAQMSDVEKRVSGKRRKELAKPLPEEALVPTDLFVRGKVDTSADVALDWFSNHSVRLPADPRIFTPVALLQIEAGKFQRNLARNLPGILPENGKYLDIGGGAGFLGLQIANAKDGVRAVLQVSDPGWSAAIEGIAEKNGGACGERIVIDPTELAVDDANSLARYLDQQSPDLLAISDPALSPNHILEALRIAKQSQLKAILFHGTQLVEHADAIRSLAASFGNSGLPMRAPFDPTIAIGYATDGE